MAIILYQCSQLQTAMFTPRTISTFLPQLPTWRLSYFFRKFTNIRSGKNLVSGQFRSPASQKSDIGAIKVSLKPNNQSALPHIELPQFPSKQQLVDAYSDTRKPSRQHHQVYRQIKKASNYSSLFHVLKKHRHHLQIEQILGAFEKLVYLTNSKINQQPQDPSEISERYSYMSALISAELFKVARPPELYIRFLSICSTIDDEDHMKAFYPILIRIFRSQLSACSGPSVEVGEISKEEPAERKEEPSLTELISIESNVKLIQAILRVLNTRAIEIGAQDRALLVAFLKASINYVHVPSTPERVQNHQLWDLVAQYSKTLHLKLGSPAVKALVRECLKRIKNEGVMKEAKNTNGQLSPIFIVNTIKKLLVVEKLLLEQCRTQSIKKEVLETKSTNLEYNPFYCIERRLDQHITELLPKCEFMAHNQATGQQEWLWQHTQLIPLLLNHFHVIFRTMPVEVIGKCGLLSGTYQQYQAALNYLGNLYACVTKSEPCTDANHKTKINGMLVSSYKLLYLLASKDVRCQIPASLTHKCLQVSLFGQLIKYFSQIPTELKIITVWNVLEQNSDIKVAASLLDNLVTCKATQGNARLAKFESFWYMRLLACHQNYKQLRAQAGNPHEEYMLLTCFKSVLKNILQYEQLCESNRDGQWSQQTGTTIGSLIKISNHGLTHLSTLVDWYKKLSIGNVLFPQHLADSLRNNKVYLSQQSEAKVSYQKSLQKLRGELADRMRACLARTQVLLFAVESGSQTQQQKLQYMSEIARAYEHQLGLLNYPVVRQKHLGCMRRMEAQISKYRNHLGV